ncbi:MAG: DUF1302 family protein [Myxococcota bacterium]
MRPSLRVAFLLISMTGIFGTTPGAAAQEADTDLEAILGGFEDVDSARVDEKTGSFPEAEASTTPTENWLDRHVDILASTSLGLSYNVDPHYSSVGPPPDPGAGTYYGNLQRLRLRSDFQADVALPENWKLRSQFYAFYDFAYVLHGEENYTDEVLDDYQLQAEILDLWLAGSPIYWLDLKLGRQVVDWGRSDSLRITDIWNPLNNREPGLVDIEDLRLPVTMARADFFLGSWSMSALVVPEIRYDYDPPPGSDFFPVVRLDEIPDPPPGGPTKQEILASLAALEAEIFASDPLDGRADRWGATPEYGASLTGIFSGWDISLYLARVYQNRTTSVTNLPDLTGGALLPLDDRITMVGAGGNYTRGAWLFKAEVAFFDEIDYAFLKPNPNYQDPTDLPYVGIHQRFSQIDWMAGVEYYGLGDVSLTLEVAHHHVIDYDPLLQYLPNYVYRDTVDTALRVSSEFLNARLMAHALGLVIVNDAGLQGAFLRLSTEYEVSQALRIDFGYLHYFGHDQIPFDSWQRNNRLFAKFTFSFD